MMEREPSPSDSSGHRTWNEVMARRYDPDAFITRSGFLIRMVQRVRLWRTARALAARSHDRILDLGCGPGNLLGRLRGRTVVGLDLSDTLLAQARARVQSLPSTSLAKGDAERLPFPASTFDRIVCSETLEHVLHPDGVLSEIHRVARPGARVVLSIPKEETINRTKRLVLSLRLKKWIAGAYPMSDNMLDQWHISEITDSWIRENTRGCFELLSAHRVPSPVIAFHRIYVFAVKKPERSETNSG
jgi:ubiquinone/menaquinone biosynthesis C-methylase UbiE